MHKYHFITSFTIAAPLIDLWGTIIDFSNWKHWWKAVKTVKIIDSSDPPKLKLTVGNFLYSLSFQIDIIDIAIGKKIVFTSSGDLQGTGTFLFQESSDKQSVNVTFDWNVKTTRLWMNVVAPVASPVFHYLHNLVMKLFVQGLAKKLHAEVTNTRHN